MDLSFVFMWIGFILASYSVVGNDVIQTLGTFLTSNEKRLQWYYLWAFASIIMAFALINGWINNDIDYGRLDKFSMPETYYWYHLLPPLILLSITRFGIPVSTTFMILTLFSLDDIPGDFTLMVNSVFDSSQNLGKMIHKSIMGYLIAFTSGLVIYTFITKITEQRFIQNPIKPQTEKFWVIFQWFTTGFLWFQWLTQDLANIYIFLKGGSDLTTSGFAISLLVLVGLLGYIFYSKGGAVQDVVRSKTNTYDIRSATFIDLIYGVILYIFKYNYLGLFEAKLPMSTTWVFIGLLAGRELGIRIMYKGKVKKKVTRMIFADLGKVFAGLVVSVVLVFLIKILAA